MQDSTDQAKDEGSSSEKTVEIARKRFRLAREAESARFTEAEEDQRFRAGIHWPEDLRRKREDTGRPCLVVNQIAGICNQLTNDQRQNKLAIRIAPVDDKADVETAKVFQGLIRSIEYDSNAPFAYNTAYQHAVESSFGYFRVITDYVSPDSFLQKCLIRQIENPLAVHLDPHSKEIDGSDANWCFIEDTMPQDDFVAEYGESKLGKASDWSSLSGVTDDWVESDSVRVCEYFWREFTKDTLYQLEDGSSVYGSDLAEGEKSAINAIAKRETTRITVKWAKLNGMELLEETTLPGEYIPVFPVYGAKIRVNGKVIYESAHRHARDPQRMRNYWKSAETEAIALAPKAPFIVAEGQIPPEYEQMWRTANQENHAFLPYVPVDLNGNLAPPPQRNAVEPAVAAITNASMGSADDVKVATNMFDAAMGNRSNEISGVAVRARAYQAQTGNFHFSDNLATSIRHCGRVLTQWIPVIYDTERVERIIGEEQDEELVTINQRVSNGGIERVLNDLSVGRYDVTVDTGPSFATKRQEAAAAMVEVAGTNPAVMQYAGDLFFKNQDWPGAQEIAERLKRTIPPQILGDQAEQPQLPPEIQAQMAQMGQMIQGLQAELAQAKNPVILKQMELASKERIELAKLESSERETLAKLEMEGNVALLKVNHDQAMRGLDASLEEINRAQEALGVETESSFQNEFGSEGAATRSNQQPTDGFSSGQFVGEEPWLS